MGDWLSAFRVFLFALLMSLPSSSLVRAHDNAGSIDSNLRVQLSEWSLEIDRVKVAAGILRVRAVNVGTLRHNFTVAKSGTLTEVYQTRLLGPGESAELPLLLAKGKYDLYCAVPGHRNSGMLAFLIVGDALTRMVPISLVGE